MNEELDFDLLVSKIQELSKTEKDFNSYINEKIHINTQLDLLLVNKHDSILTQLKKYDLDKIRDSDISKVTILLTKLQEDYVIKYRDFINEKYKEREFPEKPKIEFNSELQTTRAEYTLKLKEFNEKIKEYGIISDKIKRFNRILTVLNEYFKTNITHNILGDISLDITNKPYVYFRFYNVDDTDINVFIRNLRNSPAKNVDDILRITIEDIKSIIPDDSMIQTAKELSVYFESKDIAVAFGKESQNVVASVYQQFVLRIEYMRRFGGEWGLWLDKKTIIDNGLNMNNQVITMNDGEVQEEFDWYAKDLEIKLEECYYYHNQNFFITPKAFYDEFGIILDNKYMKISNLDKKFKKIGAYEYIYSGDNQDAENYLENNAENFKLF